MLKKVLPCFILYVLCVFNILGFRDLFPEIPKIVKLLLAGGCGGYAMTRIFGVLAVELQLLMQRRWRKGVPYYITSKKNFSRALLAGKMKSRNVRLLSDAIINSMALRFLLEQADGETDENYKKRVDVINESIMTFSEGALLRTLIKLHICLEAIYDLKVILKVESEIIKVLERKNLKLARYDYTYLNVLYRIIKKTGIEPSPEVRRLVMLEDAGIIGFYDTKSRKALEWLRRKERDSKYTPEIKETFETLLKDGRIKTWKELDGLYETAKLLA